MIMLQSNELMIGDWVLYNPNVFIEDEYEPTKECYPTKISSGEDFDLAVEGCYAPIHLTKEILEKNGFDVSEIPDYDDVEEEVFYKAVCRCKDNRGCDVEIEYRTDMNEIHVISHDFLNNLPIRQVWTQIRFVHEMQHLLVLFGIEKEIVI